MNGQNCTVVLEGFGGDNRTEDFELAVANFLQCKFSVLQQAEEYLYAYCQDMNALRTPDDEEYVTIDAADQVWKHVQFGGEAVVSRNYDSAIYISLECNCDWEREHGLQIVLKDGLVVTKVGPFDGHLTNGNASGDPELDSVVYRHF